VLVCAVKLDLERMGCGNSSEHVQEMKPPPAQGAGGKGKGGGSMEPLELPQQEIKKIQEKNLQENENPEEGGIKKEEETPHEHVPSMPSPPPPPPTNNQKKQERAGEIIANNLSMALQTKKLSKIQLEKQNEV
jgi:hypothetical protein